MQRSVLLAVDAALEIDVEGYHYRLTGSGSELTLDNREEPISLGRAARILWDHAERIVWIAGILRSLQISVRLRDPLPLTIGSAESFLTRFAIRSVARAKKLLS